ncbi:MAG: Na(+)/H(+) antiporter subunit B [Rickettsiales bacterium]|nr:Na(+)/H(+) antiporter subunit B [Rickettsiales bacterium]
MNNNPKRKLLNNIIIHVVGKLCFPIILLFAFYIQINGDNAPGGGFQAGVIAASAFILHSFIFNKDTTLKILPQTLLTYLSVFGVLLYLITGVICIILGGYFLEYNALNFINLNSKTGIVLIEWGVGITVFSIICKIYYYFL